jgi:ubiquinone/menaquinone biosynthesis C-methylase UbiE
MTNKEIHLQGEGELRKILIDPFTQKKLPENYSFKYSDHILDLYLNDESELTNIQSNFYNEVKFPNYDDTDDFGTLFDKARKSIFAKKLDEEIPFGAKLLDAGCGTGQLGIFLSRYLREIYAIDISEGSLALAKKFIDRNKIKSVNLIKMNIFNLFFKDDFFDIIISNGVLHHTHNAELAFEKLCVKLKKNGYIIVGLYHKYGRLTQKFRQFLIRIFGDNFKFLDRRFRENISKEKKYAWFLDQYKNPFEKSFTLSEVLNWFKKNKIEYVSSVPFDFSVHDKIFEKKK